MCTEGVPALSTFPFPNLVHAIAPSRYLCHWLLKTPKRQDEKWREKKRSAHRPGLFLHVEGGELKCCVTLTNALMKTSVLRKRAIVVVILLAVPWLRAPARTRNYASIFLEDQNPTCAEYNEDILNEEERNTNPRGWSLTCC